MEALAALALACNLIELVSFSGEVIQVARDVYQSGKIDADLSERASRLAILSHNVAQSLDSCPNPNTQAESDLLKTARECHEVSIELEAMLGDLSSPKKSKLGALGAALKTRISHRGRIKKLQTRMVNCQNQMDSGLLLRICSANEAQALQNRTDFKTLDDGLQRLVMGLSQGQANVVQSIKSHVTEEISKSHDMISDQIVTGTKETRRDISSALSGMQLAATNQGNRDKLLRSLKFDGMNRRANMVHDSFESTFEWLFEPDLSKDEPEIAPTWDSFITWLRSDDKIYWISRKPGSGKSTLMKFIVSHEQTRSFVKPHTIILSHFIWLAGAPMQRETRGVLFALLHQLLVEEPGLVDKALLENKTLGGKDSDADWSLSELRDCIMSSLEACPHPVCIFLDGLDEISPSEGPILLMNLVDQLSGVSNTKICVASRPEPAFQARYASQECPMLRLQDLTRRVIETVCRTSLESLDAPFILHHNTSSPGWSVADLIDILTAKAEGVFLWVHLALKSIERGVSNSDSWHEIRQRVYQLPTGLDELYKSMCQRINIDRGLYERTSALYLNLLITAHDIGKSNPGGIYSSYRTSVLELMIASEPHIQGSLIRHRGQPVEIGVLSGACVGMMNRIRSQCGGLVEFNRDTIRFFSRDDSDSDQFSPVEHEWDDIIKYYQTNVEFIHRTAFDFLTYTEAGRDIRSHDSTTEYTRSESLIRSQLIQLIMRTTGFDFGHADLEIASRYGPHHPNITDLHRYGFILFEVNFTLRPHISTSRVDDMFQLCEMAWENKIMPGILAVYPNFQLRDYLGFASWMGLYDHVKSAINLAGSFPVSRRFKGYILHCALAPFDYRAIPPDHVGTRYEHIWTGKHRLAEWLLDGGAPPSAPHYLQPLNAWYCSLDDQSLVTTPLINVILETFAGLCYCIPDLTIDLTQKPYIDLPLCTLINTLLQSKESLNRTLTVWVQSRPPIGIHFRLVNLQESTIGLVNLNYVFLEPGVVLEVNTTFLLYLLLDTLSILFPEGWSARDGQQIKSWDPALFGLDTFQHTDFKPSVCLVGYLQDRDAQPARCLSPVPLDPDDARSKLIFLANLDLELDRNHRGTDRTTRERNNIVADWMALLKDRESWTFVPSTQSGGATSDVVSDEYAITKMFLGENGFAGSPPSAEDMRIYGIPSRYGDDDDDDDHDRGIGDNDQEGGVGIGDIVNDGEASRSG